MFRHHTYTSERLPGCSSVMIRGTYKAENMSVMSATGPMDSLADRRLNCRNGRAAQMQHTSETHQNHVLSSVAKVVSTAAQAIPLTHAFRESRQASDDSPCCGPVTAQSLTCVRLLNRRSSSETQVVCRRILQLHEHCIMSKPTCAGPSKDSTSCSCACAYRAIS